MLYSVLFLKTKKENVINKFVLYFSIRMETLNVDNSLFEDSDLSQPLISANPRNADARPTCVFVTIGQDKCLKVFENRFCRGIGDQRLSDMLDEIRGTGVFKNLVQIISDVSGQHSNEIRKDFFSLVPDTI